MGGPELARIIVIGAGLTGLTTALLLSRDGHAVTVLERDAAQPEGDADALWRDWKGVSQFRLPHQMIAYWRERMEVELPEVVDGVERLGGRRSAHPRITVRRGAKAVALAPAAPGAHGVPHVRGSLPSRALRDVGPDRPDEPALRFAEMVEAVLGPCTGSHSTTTATGWPRSSHGSPRRSGRGSRSEGRAALGPGADGRPAA